MKKTLVVILIIVALPLYGYNALMLLRIAFPKVKKTAAAVKEEAGPSFERMLRAATPVRFEVKGRDPFTLSIEKPKPAQADIPVVKKKTKEVAAPPITITGILWNPKNPVATIKLPGGSKTLVKAGQKIGGNLTIKRIEKKTITVVFEGREFTITRK
ncbi:MAG: hypothetical protein JW913_00680 [Chitinispirillaceae bacterium]|nr:hypothetical protein [Chitinispirillaceae bacterium]